MPIAFCMYIHALILLYNRNGKEGIFLNSFPCYKIERIQNNTQGSSKSLRPTFAT